MYTEKQLIRVAKRENNKKRNYLVVNPLQGKHIPVIPSEALQVFEALADKLKSKYQHEKLLLVGFAETATAIGAAVAYELNSLYMQTTREQIAGVDYLFFSEEHSHATEQKLIKNDVDGIANDIDRIIFIEDEVTTGKTILNIINILEKKYPQIRKYSVASILNGMNEDAMMQYNKRKIELFYLIKTNHDKFSSIADSFNKVGEYFKPLSDNVNMNHIERYEANFYLNSRRLVRMPEYYEHICRLFEQVNTCLNIKNDNKILILGTEEFMYPALIVGNMFEQMGKSVMCHSTTRSPVAVYEETNYPLHKRYELSSLYEENRVTYIYDLERYDHVIILTDANNESERGIKSLVSALQIEKNHKISIVRWK